MADDGIDRERQAFLRRLDQGGRAVATSAPPAPGGSSGTAPPAGAWRPPIDGLPQHDLGLVTARRLRDVSLYLLVFAYLLFLLALAGVLLAVLGLPGLWRAFAFIAAAFLGIVVFISFKLLSDTARAVADLSDLGRGVEARLNVIASELQTLRLQRLAPSEPTSAPAPTDGDRVG